MGDLIASSTTDPLSEVRRSVGLSPEPTAEEQAEQQEMEHARVENANRLSPIEKMERRIGQLRAQKGEVERRASQAELENAELRQRLQETAAMAPSTAP
jgi:hypothetical protein